MSQSNQIQLIVGLGNPGPDYEKTRHNVGQWFVSALAEHYRVDFKLESKLQARIAKVNHPEFQGFLMLPTTYMNCSGSPVQAVANYYKIVPSAIVVVHDELDFQAGIVKIKRDGGHGGHNGLRDIIQHLDNANFLRFRIGIGHPGSADKVSDYVLSSPSKLDREKIEHALMDLHAAWPLVALGREAEAIQRLHTQAS
jgi:peptidyl-tRNA hydrolase, PTH1 family